MDQNAFRALLASAKSTTPAAKSAPQTKHVAPTLKADSKKSRRPWKPKETKDAEEASDDLSRVMQSYRDRAKERRTGALAEVEEDEALFRKLDYERSKYLGGDLASTHLVKGLDYVLAEQISQAMNQEQDVQLDNALEGTLNAPQELVHEDRTEAATSEVAAFVLDSARKFHPAVEEDDDPCMDPITVKVKNYLSALTGNRTAPPNRFAQGKVKFVFRLNSLDSLQRGKARRGDFIDQDNVSNTSPSSQGSTDPNSEFLQSVVMEAEDSVFQSVVSDTSPSATNGVNEQVTNQDEAMEDVEIIVPYDFYLPKTILLGKDHSEDDPFEVVDLLHDSLLQAVSRITLGEKIDAARGQPATSIHTGRKSVPETLLASAAHSDGNRVSAPSSLGDQQPSDPQMLDTNQGQLQSNAIDSDDDIFAYAPSWETLTTQTIERETKKESAEVSKTLESMDVDSVVVKHGYLTSETTNVQITTVEDVKQEIGKDRDPSPPLSARRSRWGERVAKESSESGTLSPHKQTEVISSSSKSKTAYVKPILRINEDEEYVSLNEWDLIESMPTDKQIRRSEEAREQKRMETHSRGESGFSEVVRTDLYSTHGRKDYFESQLGRTTSHNLAAPPRSVENAKILGNPFVNDRSATTTKLTTSDARTIGYGKQLQMLREGNFEMLGGLVDKKITHTGPEGKTGDDKGKQAYQPSTWSATRISDNEEMDEEALKRERLRKRNRLDSELKTINRMIEEKKAGKRGDFGVRVPKQKESNWGLGDND